jgi:hypothetical protein
MGQIIKVRCNGVNKHVNAVDVDEVMLTVPVAREMNAASLAPERTVLPCRECVGKVIVTRRMVEDASQ